MVTVDMVMLRRLADLMDERDRWLEDHLNTVQYTLAAVEEAVAAPSVADTDRLDAITAMGGHL